MAKDYGLLPTTVIGSHAIPSWLWTAIEAIDAGKYGPTDVRETFDDAVNAAILDQERAGIDVITDGEMRRWYFVQSFYKRFTGLESVGVLRKVGVYGYDSVPRYRPVERLGVPDGLGIVEEFSYLKKNTKSRIKATCPGPLTLTIHIQLKDDKVYKNRLDLAWEMAGAINAELKALAAAGAELIQIDEPSFAIIPGEAAEWVRLINAAFDGVDAKLALHVCFGNLGSRPRGRRDYHPFFPALMDARCDQFIFEFANREMKEADIYREVGMDREFGAGVIDVKSFHVETAEDVAQRVRTMLKYVPADKLWLTPDCGFFQLPRWLCALKLKALGDGVRIVRKELT
ncbi:MAG TPA: cobalamin-independent methionine synthase II family protein, partial [Chloroflexota bacterium]|nr:cobalamin-independent methionine synthase II family protein [Chloroflexota bacterium]